MPKLQDIPPGTVFETADGKRFVKADHLDRSKKARGQWECISLDDGSHPKAFPEVNHEKVTPITYFDKGPVQDLADVDVEDGTVIDIITVAKVDHADFQPLVGQRLIASWTPSTDTMAADPKRRQWISLTDGQPQGLLPLDAKVRVLYNANDPKTTEAHNELQDHKDNEAALHERLGALKSRLGEAFGPMGLTDPDGAEDLLQDAIDVLEGILNPD